MDSSLYNRCMNVRVYILYGVARDLEDKAMKRNIVGESVQ